MTQSMKTLFPSRFIREVQFLTKMRYPFTCNILAETKKSENGRDVGQNTWNWLM